MVLKNKILEETKPMLTEQAIIQSRFNSIYKADRRGVSEHTPPYARHLIKNINNIEYLAHVSLSSPKPVPRSPKPKIIVTAYLLLLLCHTAFRLYKEHIT